MWPALSVSLPLLTSSDTSSVYVAILQGNTPQAKAVARALADKMNELHEAMSEVVAKKVCKCSTCPMFNCVGRLFL